MNKLTPLFSVYYSDDAHDNHFINAPSLFEATVDAYCMLDDLNDNEWITIRDSNDKIIHEVN